MAVGLEAVEMGEESELKHLLLGGLSFGERSLLDCRDVSEAGLVTPNASAFYSGTRAFMAFCNRRTEVKSAIVLRRGWDSSWNPRFPHPLSGLS